MCMSGARTCAGGRGGGRSEDDGRGREKEERGTWDGMGVGRPGYKNDIRFLGVPCRACLAFASSGVSALRAVAWRGVARLNLDKPDDDQELSILNIWATIPH